MSFQYFISCIALATSCCPIVFLCWIVYQKRNTLFIVCDTVVISAMHIFNYFVILMAVQYAGTVMVLYGLANISCRKDIQSVAIEGIYWNVIILMKCSRHCHIIFGHLCLYMHSSCLSFFVMCGVHACVPMDFGTHMFRTCVCKYECKFTWTCLWVQPA